MKKRDFVGALALAGLGGPGASDQRHQVGGAGQRSRLGVRGVEAGEGDLQQRAQRRDVTVDGAAADTITLTDRNWRNTPISLSGDSSRRFHQIDLRIRPDTLDNVDPSRSSVEVGKWEIIPKPNG